MKKFLSLFKRKDGAVLMTAIAYMALAIALCGLITTFTLLMSKSASTYSQVNETKAIADQIAVNFKAVCSDATSISFKKTIESQYSDYEFSFEFYISGSDCSTGSNKKDNIDYYCYVYENEGDSTAIIYIEITKDETVSPTTYKYTRYEYGNI